MSLFLLFFISLYALMHSYLCVKLWLALPALGRYRPVLAAVLLVMVFLPLLDMWLDRHRHFRAASWLGVVAYVWMAIIFWFVVLSLPMDAWNLLVRLAAMAAPPVKAAAIPLRAGLVVIAALVATATVAAIREASDIRIKEITLRVPRLPPGLENLRIVQISDLHLGVHTGLGRLEKTVELVRRANPDILISTGDMLDSPMSNIGGWAKLLADVHPRFGKYAILGNHEYYVGLAESLPFHQACGFEMLRGRSVTPAPGLRLAGVDDPAGHATGQPCYDDESAALGPPTSDVTLLLKHQPRVSEEMLGRFAAQLSGHTHGGQLFPFQVFTSRIYKYYRGMYDLGGGAKLYVSLGAGTWGPPLRLFAQPEVTVFTFADADRGENGHTTKN